MTSDKKYKDSFVKQLLPYASDHKRGERAALSRYWSEASRAHAFPILGNLGALGDERKTILAALFAIHPLHKKSKMGSIGSAANQLGKTKEGDHPYERHFKRLLACETLSDLAPNLYRLCKRLDRDKIPLDYELLHKDLNFWAHYHERVKTDWAKDFWQPYLIEETQKQEESA